MDVNELKAEIVRNGMTIPVLADRMGISKKSLYERVNGNVSFSQSEITLIRDILHLENEDIIRIFFAQ